MNVIGIFNMVKSIKYNSWMMMPSKLVDEMWIKMWMVLDLLSVRLNVKHNYMGEELSHGNKQIH